MKKEDKFEEYLRKEMDSIQYDGEDRMWNGFKGQLPTVTPIQQILSWSIPLAVVGLLGLGIYLYSNGQSTDQNIIGINENTNIERGDRSEAIQKEIAKTLKDTDGVDPNSNDNPNSAAGDNKQRRNGAIENKVQNRVDRDSEVLFDKKNKNTTQKAKESGSSKSQVVQTSQTNIKGGLSAPVRQSVSQSQEQKLSIFQESNTKLSSNLNPIGNALLNSERRVELHSDDGHLIIDLIDQIDLKESFLMLEQSQVLTQLQPTSLMKKRLSNWAGYIGVGVGANNYQMYSAGVNHSRMISQRFDLNLSFGLQTELGNIVSQDSLIKEIGPAIVETRKNKDLNDLTSIYVAAVPLFRIGQFGIGIGPKVSCGVSNRFKIEEIKSSVNSPDFNVVLPLSSGSTHTTTQDWSSLNRLRLGGDLILQYQSQSRFGMQLHLSKNLNKLIKDDLAVTDRSNSPIVLGLQLNYLIKN